MRRYLPDRPWPTAAQLRPYVLDVRLDGTHPDALANLFRICGIRAQTITREHDPDDGHSYTLTRPTPGTGPLFLFLVTPSGNGGRVQPLFVADRRVAARLEQPSEVPYAPDATSAEDPSWRNRTSSLGSPSIALVTDQAAFSDDVYRAVMRIQAESAGLGTPEAHRLRGAVLELALPGLTPAHLRWVVELREALGQHGPVAARVAGTGLTRSFLMDHMFTAAQHDELRAVGVDDAGRQTPPLQATALFVYPRLGRSGLRSHQFHRQPRHGGPRLAQSGLCRTPSPR